MADQDPTRQTEDPPKPRSIQHFGRGLMSGPIEPNLDQAYPTGQGCFNHMNRLTRTMSAPDIFSVKSTQYSSTDSTLSVLYYHEFPVTSFFPPAFQEVSSAIPELPLNLAEDPHDTTLTDICVRPQIPLGVECNWRLRNLLNLSQKHGWKAMFYCASKRESE
ncbi:hypothetical protein AAP_06237 [Ascosphaera apis ARSEF 7405]|uniref:Uncharacterized protein n=1 Tax=Ascosphaera apis ARSEF 7405 TaxID=392613 RepID=A0A167UY81_9EURO|nr:hypothetical protein AAP_06237 [Ascosphaera apis ARSEF 7405]